MLTEPDAAEAATSYTADPLTKVSPATFGNVLSDPAYMLDPPPPPAKYPPAPPLRPPPPPPLLGPPVMFTPLFDE